MVSVHKTKLDGTGMQDQVQFWEQVASKGGDHVIAYAES